MELQALLASAGFRRGAAASTRTSARFVNSWGGGGFKGWRPTLQWSGHAVAARRCWGGRGWQQRHQRDGWHGGGGAKCAESGAGQILAVIDTCFSAAGDRECG